MRRAVASPFLLLALWLLTLLLTLPAAWMVQEEIRADIGSSGVYSGLLRGFDMEWFGEFESRTSGLASTVTPTHTGMGGYVDNFEAMLTGSIFTSHWTLPALSALFGICWLIALGGAIERFCDRGPSFAPFRFVGSGGRYLFRLLRLTLISAPLYAGVFLSARWLLESMKRATRDVSVESTVMLYTMLIWLAAGLLLTLIHAVFGFAKVAIVADERRSAFLAAVRGLVFVTLHPAKTMGLYYALLSIGLLGVLLFSFVAPGAGQESASAIAWAFATSQLLLLFRLTMRLSLVAGQVALYRAHGMPQPEPVVAAPAAVEPAVAGTAVELSAVAPSAVESPAEGGPDPT